MSEDRLSKLLIQGIEDDAQEEIGKGAYCTVVKMKFRGLTCAGKKIHHFFTEHVSQNEKRALLDRFAEECELLSRLHHPNIIQFLGIHKSNQGIPILVMEYMENSLTRLVEEEGPLVPEIAAGILKDVALGLAYLHGHAPPIIHRDLTANNVLLTVGMRAKLADLGVARILNISPTEAAKVTQCPGTPVYMPPEALHNDPSYDTRIDCFSFGVLIIHILSGQWPLPSPPTRVNPVTSALEAVSEYDRRGKYVQDIPKDLPLLVLAKRFLENDPRRRPLMDEVIKELEEYGKVKDSQVHTSKEIRALTEELRTSKEKLQSSQADVERLTLSQSVLEAQVKVLSRAQDEKVELQRSITAQSKAIEDKESTIASLSHQLSRVQVFLSSTSPFPLTQIEWTKCTDLPSAASSLQILAFYDMVFVGGGHSDNPIVRRSLYASKDLKSWQAFDILPITAYAFGKGMTKVMMISGSAFDTGKVVNSIWTLDPLKKTFAKLSNVQFGYSSYVSLPTGRALCSAVTVPSKGILVIGGINSVGNVVDNCDCLLFESGQWECLPPLPKPLYSTTCLFVNDRFYVAGGYSSANPLKSNRDIFCLDWDKKEWSMLCTAPYSYSCYVLMAGMLTAINGCTSEGRRMKTVLVFSESSQAWVKIGEFPEDLLACSGCCLPTGELIVVGGANTDKTKSCSVYKGRMRF